MKINKLRGDSLGQRAKEAAICIGLGIRSSVSPRATVISALLWVVVVACWLLAFVTFRSVLVELALKASSILILAVAILIPGALGSTPGVVGGGLGGAIMLMSSMAMSWLFLGFAYLAAVLLTVRLLGELWLMKWIRRQALKCYPSLENSSSRTDVSSRSIAWSNVMRPWIALTVAAPACLLVPFLGGICLFLLLSYLNVRFLVNDAVGTLANPKEIYDFLRDCRFELLSLGLLVTLLSVVPLVGFLVPWAAGSAVCHLLMRHLAAERALPEGPKPRDAAPGQAI